MSDNNNQPNHLNQQWRLVKRPQGLFQLSDFEFREEPLADLADGQILVKINYLSLDPTQRVWAQSDSYLPAVELGSVMRSLGMGEVIASQNPKFNPGDIVQGMTGWQSHLITDGKGFAKVPRLPGVPLAAFLGPLGMTGMTAYVGLLDIGKPKEGETVVVSGAAGAVGSMVCQIAKLKGCHVVGIAGSDEKCAWLKSLGVDGAINYKSENLYKSLKRNCPKGIDIYFENVGGKMLDAVLGQINVGARIPLCGYISQYTNPDPSQGIQNLSVLISKRAKIEGFLVLDHMQRATQIVTELATWAMSGKLKYQLDIVKGLKEAPIAVNKLFEGSNEGKLIIEV
ncbi:MAG: NADP-dependent oxidoreductase [Deinococcales bacterium]